MGRPPMTLRCHLTMRSPVVSEAFTLHVAPGSYNWNAEGENYKHEKIGWSGVKLANYPYGGHVMLACE